MSAQHDPEAPRSTELAIIQAKAEGLVRRAEALGIVLTIEQVSVPPWASGRYETRVTVRPARKPGGKY